MIQLGDIRLVEEALKKKLVWMNENEPYAKYDIENIETALRVLDDLELDVDDCVFNDYKSEWVEEVV